MWDIESKMLVETRRKGILFTYCTGYILYIMGWQCLCALLLTYFSSLSFPPPTICPINGNSPTTVQHSTYKHAPRPIEQSFFQAHTHYLGNKFALVSQIGWDHISLLACKNWWYAISVASSIMKRLGIISKRSQPEITSFMPYSTYFWLGKVMNCEKKKKSPFTLLLPLPSVMYMYSSNTCLFSYVNARICRTLFSHVSVTC